MHDLRCWQHFPRTVISNWRFSSQCIHYGTHSSLFPPSASPPITASWSCMHAIFTAPANSFPIKKAFLRDSLLPCNNDWYGTWCFPCLITMILTSHCGFGFSADGWKSASRVLPPQPAQPPFHLVDPNIVMNAQILCDDEEFRRKIDSRSSRGDIEAGGCLLFPFPPASHFATCNNTLDKIWQERRLRRRSRLICDSPDVCALKCY